MKSTGIVRKIDELGRIVIPKEIRRSLNIGDSEEVEIYVDENTIILKKYYRLLSLKELAINFINAIEKYLNCNLFLTDKEKILYTTKEKYKNYIEEKINKNIIDIINERKTVIEKGKILLTKDYFVVNYYIIVPIVINADSIGSIICTSNEQINEKINLIIDILISLIKKQIEK